MKKVLKLIKFISALLIVAGSLASCGDEKETDPVEIPFTEYSLSRTNCQWTNLNYDGKVIIINSNEELKNYINCTEGSYPDIDFSKNTLLLASGNSAYSISDIVKQLQQIDINKYTLNVDITLHDATIVQRWFIAIVVGILNTQSEIELKVTNIRN